MTLEKGLTITGLKDEFIRRGREGASQSELVAWMRTHPELLSICSFPNELKAIRRKLDCAAPPGGRRPHNRTSPLRVYSRHNQ